MDGDGLEREFALRSQSGRHRGALLLLSLGFALVLRVYGLGAEDFWLDEIHTMVNAEGRRAQFETLPNGVILPRVTTYHDLNLHTGIVDVWRGLEADNHPPVFFVFFHCWRRLIGEGEFVARLPAAIFSVLSLLPLAMIIRVGGKYQVGIWIVVGLAVSFAHVHMAQQCRPYSLGMLLTAISYWSLIRMNSNSAALGQRPRLSWWIVYGASTYLAVMTHYFTAIAMVGQILLAGRYIRGRLLRSWICALTVAMAAFAVTWGPQICAQYDFIKSHAWLLEDGPHHVWWTLLRFADLPFRLLFVHEPFRLSVLKSGLCIVLLVGVILFSLRSRQLGTTVFACWYLAGAGAFACLDLVTGRQTLSHIRYVSVLTPGLVGVLVCAAWSLSARRRIAVATIFVIAVALTLPLPTQDNPHGKTAAGLIAPRIQPDTLLVFDAIGWPPFWASQIYHNVAIYLGRIPDTTATPTLILKDDPSPALKREMEEYKRLVVVSPRHDPVPNPLPSHFRGVGRTSRVNQIGWIYTFDRAF